MGGKVNGIYPANLTLGFTDCDPCKFNTLDVCIETRAFQVRNAAGGVTVWCSLLHDCMTKADKHAMQVSPLSSIRLFPAHCGYNFLIGQLHRFRELITVRRRGNCVLGVAKLLLRMQSRGYLITLLWKKLKHHLRMYPGTYGDAIFHGLLIDITHCYDPLCRHYGEAASMAWEACDTDWAS